MAIHDVYKAYNGSKSLYAIILLAVKDRGGASQR